MPSRSSDGRAIRKTDGDTLGRLPLWRRRLGELAPRLDLAVADEEAHARRAALRAQPAAAGEELERREQHAARLLLHARDLRSAGQAEVERERLDVGREHDGLALLHDR